MRKPRHIPDSTQRRQIEAMAAYGLPEAGIARIVGIEARLLRRHYGEELDTGQLKATARVAESLFRRATSEGPQSVAAAIFWLKTRAGWKETSVQELSGPEKTPIIIEQVRFGDDPPPKSSHPNIPARSHLERS